MQEQFTVRIYDVELVNRIKDLEKQLKNIYHSKRNPFLVDCIIKGMEVIERDRLGIKNPKDLKELYDEVHKTFEKLNELMKLCETTSKECMANITVNQKLLTNNYNMLLGLSEEAPIDRESVEEGIYEKLPNRFEEMLEGILEDVLKVVTKKNKWVFQM